MAKILSIEGNIGSGKSTLLEMLARSSKQIELVREPVTNWESIKGYNLLSRYYSDQKRWAFTFQLNALLTRMKTITEILERYDQKKIYLLERSINSDKNIFAKLLYYNKALDQMEYEIYKNSYETLSGLFKIPQNRGYIYLRVSPKKCMERIRKRRREGEQKINQEYLETIHSFHQQWFKHERNPWIQINGESEFERDDDLPKDILSRIDSIFKTC